MEIDLAGIRLVEEIVEDLARNGLTPYGFLMFYEDIQNQTIQRRLTAVEKKEREGLIERWTQDPNHYAPFVQINRLIE